MSLEAIQAFVVEDHAFQRGGIVSLLRAIGIRHIREAANGREALAMLAADRNAFPPDVILCDLEMPEVDGIEFLRTVAERKLAHAVVIISGREPEILASVEAMLRALGLAVFGTLGKPVSPEALWAVLSSNPQADPQTAVARGFAGDTAELQRAVEAREFQCEFQPKVRLATGALVGVEALARWRPPGAASIGPGEFVPAMVRAGLIGPLTTQMLDAACLALTAWDRQGLTLTAAVNVSMAILADLQTTDRFVAQVRAHGVDPRRITFEVTETEVMSDVAAVLTVLARLRLKGFYLAIDDFGTGYASLAQLNTIPFTELKIDQTFVRNCGQSSRLRNIVRSSIELARRLGIRTVAEGVESCEEWDFLRLAGCDEGQGHYIARPMPEAEIPVYARRPQRHLADGGLVRVSRSSGERA
jgi:EAL domain-containing protein (putative c-di-GMP-specific phosphodiesterase class I)/ActR/RegA family two-component response regulator